MDSRDASRVPNESPWETPGNIPLENLYETYTSQQQVKDSFEKRTAPTGRYTFYASKADAKKASDASPWPGRPMGSFFGQIKDEDGKRIGAVGFDASWVVEHWDNPNGHKVQDFASSLWGQLVVALDMRDAPVGEVIKAVSKYPLGVYVIEQFQDPTTKKWATATTADDRALFRKSGFDSRNRVKGISKIK